MPPISKPEFEQLPLRVHQFLAGVPLHDAWAVDLPRRRSGITLAEFQGKAGARPFKPSAATRMLFNLRFFVGRRFGWDREPAASSWESFARRLTPADRVRSLVPPGTPEGHFRVVYRFENEQLLEIVNRTVHAAALTALIETESAYRYYLGVYVRNISRFTPVYMTAIGPFRRWIVYPSALRSVSANWIQAFGTV
jgi:hypothetical protein